MTWDVHRLPRAEGRTFLVTGGNAGIGYFVAEQLAGTGATVVLGSRDPAKADAAAGAIRARVRDAQVRHVRLDLADLSSLAASVDALGADRLDAVVCNAGTMLDHQPRQETAAGHEMMFGVNHLGHFALVARLAPLLSAQPGSRVVTTGSFVGKRAQLDLDDLQTSRGYKPMLAYSRSKLAQMLFGFELDRRLRAAGHSTTSVVVHPGGALDSLTAPRPPVHVRTAGTRLRALAARIVLQGKDAGAWPAVRATLDPTIQSGQMWGPRFLGTRGAPRREPVRGTLADPDVASHVWTVSRELTGVEPTF
ncbi:SDR family NAD(P)-dependent oxidoreductase [Actinophytocola sp.]|uniref:SDR family NAD(P)-dependent oxidoreductase n=1 Tax=Actinophytocola sp. TaxID=1872138 RepID=UPI002ED2F1E3